MKKKIGFVVILALAIAAVYFFFIAKKTAPTAITSSAEEASTTATSFPQKNSASVASVSTATTNSSSPATMNLADRAAIAATPPTTASTDDIPPAIVLENVSRAIRQYGALFGGNPVGTNPEITAALNGGNPKQINFIKPEAGMRINEKGEMVDQWDTPFFFHQLSGTETEIHSAGPDKIMWTGDDVVAK